MLRIYPPPVVDIDVEEAYAHERVAEGRPWVLMNMIASADGAIEIDGVSGPLGGPADRAAFAAIRSYADVILVGSQTIRAEGSSGPSPSEAVQALRRRHGVWAVPRLAIVSASLDFTWDEPLWRNDLSRPLILTAGGAAQERLTQARRHADVVVAGQDRVDMGRAIDELADLGARVILTEGGPALNGQLFAADLVDELCLTYAPMLVGGKSRRIDAGPTIAPPHRLTLAHVLADDGFLLTRYLRDRSGDRDVVG